MRRSALRFVLVPTSVLAAAAAAAACSPSGRVDPRLGERGVGGVVYTRAVPLPVEHLPPPPPPPNAVPAGASGAALLDIALRTDSVVAEWILARDTILLGRVMAPDFAALQLNGRVATRDRLFADLANGSGWSAYQQSDRAATIEGRGVTVRGRLTTEAWGDRGRALTRLVYARDYEVRDGLLVLTTVVIKNTPTPGAATH
jgi:hypothetical protein